MSRAPLFVAVFFSSVASAVEFQVFPPDPRPGEAFAIVAAFESTQPSCGIQTATVERIANDIRIIPYGGKGYGGNTSSCRAGALVDGLPAGSYAATAALFPPVLAIGNIQVQGDGPAEPAHRGLDGNWFDPAEPGWGVNIVQGDSGKLLAMWMAHVPAGSGVTTPALAQWLAMTDGRWITPTTFRGVLTYTRGSGANMPFDASRLQVAAVGYAELTFTGTETARFRGRFVTDGGTLAWIDRSANLRRFGF